MRSSRIRYRRGLAMGAAEFEYDVFISYWTRDREWVEILAGNLERLGIRTWWDGFEIIPGDLPNLRIDEGLQRSRCGIVVCSDGAERRPYIAEEYAALRDQAVRDQGRRLIPVLYRFTGRREDLRTGLKVRAPVDFREVDEEGYKARLQELANAIQEARRRRPAVGEPIEYPESDLESRAPWEAQTELKRILMREPGPLVEKLDAQLPGAHADGKLTTDARAAHVAAKIDALGEGGEAAKKLVGACYLALSAIAAIDDRAGARRVLRELLSAWLEQRYANHVEVTTRSRSSEEEGVEDLVVTARKHEIAVIPAARWDRRLENTPKDRPCTLYVTHESGGVPRVVPAGSIRTPLSSPEIGDVDKLAEELARGLDDQLPSESDADPESRRADAKEWFAHTRGPGIDFDPRHLAVSTRGVEARRRGDLEALLCELKRHYPALRLIEHEGSAPEEQLWTKLLSIFKDE